MTALLQRAQAKPAAFWELPPMAASDLIFVLWLLHLQPQNAASVATRVRLPEDLKAAIVSANRLRTEKDLGRLKPSQLVARLEREPMLALYALSIAIGNSAPSKRLELFAKKLRSVHPRTDGKTLQSAGLKPGPAYKQILLRLRAAWLDGEIRNARQEQVLLESLLREYR
jgi:tRNA nucleotidyltransferase (CCA-adding enzyme)